MRKFWWTAAVCQIHQKFPINVYASPNASGGGSYQNQVGLSY